MASAQDLGIPDLIDQPPLAADAVHHEDDEDSEEDGDEELVQFIDTPCQDLFSDKVFASAQECIDHCKNVHGFDLKVLKKRHAMDCFAFIRLVNFIRTSKPSACLVMSLASDELWQSQDFMKPVVPDDPLLMYDFEAEDGWECDGQPQQWDSADCVPELKASIKALLDQLQERDRQLQSLQTDLENMHRVAAVLFQSDQQAPTAAPGQVSVTCGGGHDSSYIRSYSHFGIHHEMLSDTVRTETYRQAIIAHSDRIQGKIVLDVGCGTGILSMFCAKFGKAAKVIGVDMADVIVDAMDIIRENNLEDQIDLVKGRVEELVVEQHVPAGQCGKVDVLVSEWMGYFLLFEGMLDSVIEARDRFLRHPSTDLILPNRCSLNLVAVSDERRYADTVSYWDNVYGFKMTCMKQPSLCEASVELVDGSAVVSAATTILALDLNVCTVRDTEFSSPFQLLIQRDCKVTAVAGYFDTFFEAKAGPEVVVSFSTGPGAKATHWKQTVFYLSSPLAVTSGQTVSGTISVRRAETNRRHVQVDLQLGSSRKQTYYIE